MKRVRVIGCGAPDAGDDQLGLIVARRLRRQLAPKIDIREHTAGGARIDEWCADVQRLIVIDAARAEAGLAVGQHLRIDYPAQRHLLERCALRGTHSISIESGLRLAETLGWLPPHVVLHLIGASRFEPGAPLSPELEAPLQHLVAQLAHELSKVR